MITLEVKQLPHRQFNCLTKVFLLPIKLMHILLLGLNYLHLANYEEAHKMFKKSMQITDDSLTVYIAKK